MKEIGFMQIGSRKIPVFLAERKEDDRVAIWLGNEQLGDWMEPDDPVVRALELNLNEEE